MRTEAFSIAPFFTSEAENLSRMMVANKDHFALYLPKTLAQNQTVADAEAYIQRKQREFKQNKEYTFGIKEHISEKIAGIIILKKIDWEKKQGELAYGMCSSFEGRGWMSQSVGLVSTYAFDTLQLKTLQIIVHQSNMGSCKVAVKNGFVWKETLKAEFTPVNGSPLDMELYERYGE